jgi:hypothetical protein
MSHARIQQRDHVNKTMNIQASLEAAKILTSEFTIIFLERSLFHGVSEVN